MIPEYLFKQAEREANAAMMKELYTEGSMEPAVAGMDPENIDPEVAAAINTILGKLQKPEEPEERHTVEKASGLRGCIFKAAEDASLEDIKRFIENSDRSEPSTQPSEPPQLTDMNSYRRDMLNSLSANPSFDDKAEDIVNRVNSIYKNPSYASTGLNDPVPLFSGKERYLANFLNEANDAIPNELQTNSGELFGSLAKKINSSIFGNDIQAVARENINNLLDRNRQRREKYLTEPSNNIYAGNQ